MSTADTGRPARDDDVELLASARAGDRAAVAALVERYQDRVLRFGMKMCGGNIEDAEDVRQDTLFALTRGVTGFRGASSLSTWLYAVARSYCMKKRRKAKGADKPRPPDDDAPLAPDEIAAQGELAVALHGAIAGLDMQGREVLVLRDVEGLAAAEVARMLGISEAAVKSRLHRARRAVRAALQSAIGVS